MSLSSIEKSRAAIAAYNQRLVFHEPDWSCVECGEVYHDECPDDTQRSPECEDTCLKCAEDVWPKDPIQEKFEAFHAENPGVYAELVKLALRVRGAGRARYGIATLFEVMRYRRDIQTSGDVFKLNNNFRALYARKIMEENPELDGLFATRTRTSQSR